MAIFRGIQIVGGCLGAACPERIRGVAVAPESFPSYDRDSNKRSRRVERDGGANAVEHPIRRGEFCAPDGRRHIARQQMGSPDCRRDCQPPQAASVGRARCNGSDAHMTSGNPAITATVITTVTVRKCQYNVTLTMSWSWRAVIWPASRRA